MHLANTMTEWEPTTGSDEFKVILDYHVGEQDITYYTGWLVSRR